jgi:hypothetical protein
MTYKFILLLTAAAQLSGKRFYSDDPLPAEPKNRNVATVENRKLSDYYDLFSHQFAELGERHPVNGPPIRAKGVNTLGEPMDGAWWARRHYYKRMSLEELKRGPGQSQQPPADGKWRIVGAKTEGVTPGFTIRDANEQLFFIKFDPLSNPEMASSCDAIVSRIFHALGYHVPQNDIIHITPSQLVIGPDVMVSDKKGNERKMTQADLDLIFSKVPKGKDGRYRATASQALPGKPIGPPRYYGTRTDDPNDIVPHEHLRELRGLHVIDAWIDHDDSRAINNLDILFKDGGTQYVKHYMLDFGSTLGSGTQKANSPRSGSYFFTWKDSAKQFFTLGMMPPYWAFAKYPDLPSVGRFEWKVFDPERWVPEYPNPAFRNRLPEDEFWAAKLVTAFTDEDLKALISTGDLSDPKASAWLLECLSKRRDKIGKAYFSKLLPLDQFAVKGDSLAWVDLGSTLGYLPAAELSLQWFSFDNETEKKTALAGQTSARLPSLSGKPSEGYYGLTLTNAKNPRQTIDVFLRGNQVVGIDRNW